MMVPGDQWPVFLYKGYVYDADDPWKGLFRSNLLVYVNFAFSFPRVHANLDLAGLQTYLHIPQFG